MDEKSVDTEVAPFRIDVPQADLDDLRDRLARTRWPDQLPGAGWDYGIPLEYVRGLASYWRDEYDWRVHEARLNGFDQFVTTIDGARVHFLHVRSAAAGAMPLIITHGWPGSVVEFWDRRFAEQSDTIVRWTEFGRGGHFAAMEAPDLLVGDVREFFRALR